MKELQNQIGITGLTMKQLTDKAHLLKMTLKNLIPGSADYKRYQDELSQVSARIGELNGKSSQAGFSIGSLADKFNRYAALGASVLGFFAGMVVSVQKIIDLNGKLSDAQANVMKTTGMTKDEVDEYGTDVSQASGWDGVQAADAIAFTLRMNGFHKQADLIQSIFDNKPYMKALNQEGRISLSKMVNESEAEEIANLTGLRTQAVKKFIDDNNIDDRKLLAYLKIKGPKTLSNRMDISTAIVGKSGNKFAQGIIKAFQK